MIKIIIADDHILMAESLKLMLEQDKEIQVVCIARDGEEAIEGCQKHMPDIIFMDIKMPQLNGIKASERIKSKLPEIKIIILTTIESDSMIFEAMTTGVDGFLLKSMNSSELISVIRCINNGLCVVDKRIMNFFERQIKGEVAVTSESSLLSEEDIHIIKLLGDGKTNREIAALLNYSDGTIKNKISRMLSQLNINDRTQLVVHALKNEWI